jgi:hypothetical protein
MLLSESLQIFIKSRAISSKKRNILQTAYMVTCTVMDPRSSEPDHGARGARSSWLAGGREASSLLPRSEDTVFVAYGALRAELTPKASPKSIFR